MFTKAISEIYISYLLLQKCLPVHSDSLLILGSFIVSAQADAWLSGHAAK